VAKKTPTSILLVIITPTLWLVRLHNELERSTIFRGHIHDFYGQPWAPQAVRQPMVCEKSTHPIQTPGEGAEISRGFEGKFFHAVYWVADMS
jgi:hypothetical protein